MAYERAVGVGGIRDLAGRTREDVPAAAAEDLSRVSPTIQIQHRLAAVGDGALQRGAQRSRERAAVAAAQLEPQVDDRRRRQWELADALRQREERERATACGLERHHAGRRASEHDRRGRDLADCESGIDRVIARVALLLV